MLASSLASWLGDNQAVHEPTIYPHMTTLAVRLISTLRIEPADDQPAAQQ